MGTFEMINAILSLLGGGIMTMWAQGAKDRHEERLHRLEMADRTEGSTTAAREHKAQWKGFYWIRGTIALIVTAYFFIVPSVAVFIAGVQIVIGYYDVSAGLWPWSSNIEAVAWVKAGAADPDHIIVMDPVRNNVLISIIGMYFGNQFARRG
jgi:hypothetical protein